MAWTWQRTYAITAIVMAAAFLEVNAPLPGEEPSDQPKRSKLAVLVVFDQMRGDYPQRWEKLYGEGGFKRLQQEGASFTNCHYPFAGTWTAAGHTSLVTGCSPNKHGVIANDWYDRKRGRRAGSVSDERYALVPAPMGAKKPVGVSPQRRRQPTVGDSLLTATKGNGKVVSISIKDRAALLMAALRALCFWFSGEQGMFVTSTHYADTLPAWVTEFNSSGSQDKWFGQQWDRFRPMLRYEDFSGPDEQPSEGIGYKQGRTFPHPMSAGAKPKSLTYYEAVANSPFGNEMLLDLAKRAIEAEKLGQDDDPDLLCLGFSSNDLVGHTWGPDSQEVLDITLRSDAIIKELLDLLDAKVGKGNYVLVLSADHGIAPIPELAAAKGKKAGRVNPKALAQAASDYLTKAFAKDGENLVWFEHDPRDAAFHNGFVYLNRNLLKERALDRAKVERGLADWLVQQPHIQAAYTRSDLLKARPKNDPLGEQVWLSFHPEESGDVIFVLEPYFLLTEPITSPDKLAAFRTTHGSPHSYDTWVPLMVYGPGVRRGLRDGRVSPLATAAILSRALGIPRPAGAESDVPAGLFGER
jgi:hypothetical protein